MDAVSYIARTTNIATVGWIEIRNVVVRRGVVGC